MAAAVGAGFLTACTLVLPWFHISGRARSSIDLISSAGALDVIGGGTRLLVVALWLLLPVLVAVAMLLYAAQRSTASAILIALVGAVVLVVLAVGFVVDGVALAWGAAVAAVCAVVAVSCAMMDMMFQRGRV